MSLPIIVGLAFVVVGIFFSAFPKFIYKYDESIWKRLSVSYDDYEISIRVLGIIFFLLGLTALILARLYPFSISKL